ncbi:MAG: putative Ig domain-containing protein, partial [Nitrosopumilus sp.]|nr:putative Ig domain-containing protein [Nitrosopumilus sp.]
MNIKLTGFAVFSLFTLMIVPVHADVTSVSLVKSFYTNDESIAFKGIESTGSQSVFVIIRDPSGAFQGMVSDPVSDPDGIFSTIPRAVDVFFKSKGIYDATAFTDEQKESEGITLQIEYDGDKVFLVPDFILALKSISDKTIEEEKTLSFTVSLVEITDDVIFSLEKNPPSGATINSDTGKFTWTPTKSQAPGSYTFDIVVKKGGLEDRESIKVTVTEKPEPVTQKPKPEPVVTKDPEPKTTEPKEVEIPATFVDTKLDPQYYVDRYNNEPKYKEWFDDNYSEYSSIYQAVGLEEPVELAPFVDTKLDPQYYVDRYNNEPKYKEWFDDNYSEYSS